MIQWNLILKICVDWHLSSHRCFRTTQYQMLLPPIICIWNMFIHSSLPSVPSSLWNQMRYVCACINMWSHLDLVLYCYLLFYRSSRIQQFISGNPKCYIIFVLFICIGWTYCLSLLTTAGSKLCDEVKMVFFVIKCSWNSVLYALILQLMYFNITKTVLTYCLIIQFCWYG